MLFQSFSTFFSPFLLSILCLFYNFAFLCFVVLCFVIDPSDLEPQFLSETLQTFLQMMKSCAVIGTLRVLTKYESTAPTRFSLNARLKQLVNF